tara:strand:+ start:208 stop:522 length:315 start_codon:yes stop_codon:yes gene_type:complete
LRSLFEIGAVPPLFLLRFCRSCPFSSKEASFEEKGQLLQNLKRNNGGTAPISKSDRKGLKKVYRQELVKRSAVFRIVAAWIVTVPLSGLLAAMLFFTIRGMLLP